MAQQIAKLIVPEGESIKDALLGFLDSTFYPYFREKSYRVVNDFVRDKEGKYTISVDNRPVASITQINQAKKYVSVVYFKQGIDLALATLRQTLVNAIQARHFKADNVPSGYIEYGSLQDSVEIFYFDSDKGGRTVNITNNLDYITNFKEGDFISIVPTFFTQVYANTKLFTKNVKLKGRKTGGGGFMGLAARRIRSQLGMRSRLSGNLSVTASRSKAAFNYIESTRPASTARNKHTYPMSHPEYGAWVILIKYKRLQFSVKG